MRFCPPRPGSWASARPSGCRRSAGRGVSMATRAPAAGRCHPRADSHRAPRPAGNYSPQKALRGSTSSQQAVRLPPAVPLRFPAGCARPPAPRCWLVFGSHRLPRLVAPSHPLLCGAGERLGRGDAAVLSRGLGRVREVPEPWRPSCPSVLCAAPQQTWRRPRGRGGRRRPGSRRWLCAVSRAVRWRGAVPRQLRRCGPAGVRAVNVGYRSSSSPRYW